MVIDLHGQVEREAVGSILTALISFKDNEAETFLEIITGQGEVLKDLAIELVEEEGFNWKFENNNYGAIIVSKN